MRESTFSVYRILRGKAFFCPRSCSVIIEPVDFISVGTSVFENLVDCGVETGVLSTGFPIVYN